MLVGYELNSITRHKMTFNKKCLIYDDDFILKLVFVRNSFLFELFICWDYISVCWDAAVTGCEDMCSCEVLAATINNQFVMRSLGAK